MRMYKKISIGLILCAVLLPNIASAAAYSDIAGHLDEKYVVGYSDLGLVNGYPDGTFRPDVTLTRAEATVLFGKLNLPAINGKQADFRDIAKTDWFYDSVDTAVKADWSVVMRIIPFNRRKQSHALRLFLWYRNW